MTDWDKFRTLRSQIAEEIENPDDWINQLESNEEAATESVPVTAEMQFIDSRLLHMWQAHESPKKMAQTKTQ